MLLGSAHLPSLPALSLGSYTAYRDHLSRAVLTWGCRIQPAHPALGEPALAALKRIRCAGALSLPAACTFLKSQLHAYYSSPGMKLTVHVASPHPQHELAYLGHVVSSTHRCCQKRRARLLITCQWAWREGNNTNGHPGAKRDSLKSWKQQPLLHRWAILEVWKGCPKGQVQLWPPGTTSNKVWGLPFHPYPQHVWAKSSWPPVWIN